MSKVYYFGAEWCHQCSAVYPQFKDYCDSKHIDFEYVDVECNETLCTTFCIRNLPTIIVTKDNNEIEFKASGFDGFNKFKETY